MFLSTLYEGTSGYVYAPARSKNEWKYRFFRWPVEREALESWILTEARDSDVYIGPALYKEKRATKENVIGARVCWVEFDGVSRIDLKNLPRPSMVVQTSVEHHQHIYWKVHGVKSDVLEDINKRLTYHLDADTSGWDCTQILRPPMTFNHKRGKQLQVKLVHKPSDETHYHELKAFDGLASLPDVQYFENPGDLPSPVDVFTTNGQMSWTVWELIRQPRSDIGHRSEYLMQLGYELAKCRLRHEEIISILQMMDEKIGKFAYRSDQLTQLSRIASLAIAKYGGATTLQLYSHLEIMNLPTKFESYWANFLPHKNAFMITGSQGIGKSHFSMNAAAYFSLGKSFLGFSTGEAKVLFLSMEMNKEDLQYFLNLQMQPYKPLEHLKISENLKFMGEGCPVDLLDIEALIEMFEPNIVMFDSLSSMVDEELNEKTAKALTKWDQSLRNKYGIVTWWIHHNRKAQQGTRESHKLADVLGSSQLTRLSATVMTMYETSNKSLRMDIPKLRFGKANHFGLVKDEHLNFRRPEQGQEQEVVSPEPDPTPINEGGDDGLSLDFN